MKNALRNGSFESAQHPVPPVDMPEAALRKAPQRPELNVLVWTHSTPKPGEESSAACPLVVAERWTNHPHFSAEWGAISAQLEKEGISAGGRFNGAKPKNASENPDANVTPGPGKRGRDPADGAEEEDNLVTPPKKSKGDTTAKVSLQHVLMQKIIAEVPFGGTGKAKKDAFFTACEDGIYAVNKGDEGFTVLRGFCCFLFPPKFKQTKAKSKTKMTK